MTQYVYLQSNGWKNCVNQWQNCKTCKASRML